MKEWLRTAALLYPSDWRARYGEELDALIEDSGGGWREFADICKGAMTMQIRGMSMWRFVAGCAVAGLLIAVIAAWTAPRQYQSIAVLRMPDGEVQETGDRLNKAEQDVLSRRSLSALIQSEDLYPKERTREPLEDIVSRMRNQDIQIRVLQVPGANTSARAFSISFNANDALRAQAVTRELTTRFVSAMPPTSRLEVLDPASLPERAFAPNRAAWVGTGLIIGLAAGFVMLGIRRWPLVALAGVITAALVWPATYVVPDRFRSVAVLRSRATDPAQVTAGIVSDPAYLQTLVSQFGLYQGDANAVGKMRQSLSVRDVNGPSAKVCLVTFDYSDRYKAQQVLGEILARAGGVEVLDPPSLPEHAFTPNRLAIVMAGLFAGMLLGVVALAFRRRRAPALIA